MTDEPALTLKLELCPRRWVASVRFKDEPGVIYRYFGETELKAKRLAMASIEGREARVLKSRAAVHSRKAGRLRALAKAPGKPPEAT